MPQCASDFVYAERTVIAFIESNFGDLRDICVVTFHQGNTVKTTLRCLPPTGFRRDVEHIAKSLGSVAIEHCQAIRNWILACGRRQLVDEAFIGEAIERMRNRAPVADPHTGIVYRHLNTRIGNVVRQHGGLCHEWIDTIFDHRWKQPRRNRWRGEPEFHRNRIAVGIQTCGERVQADRSIEVMRHVVFARPDQLHRFANRLGNLYCLHNEVDIDTSAESATQKSSVYVHFVFCEAGDLHRNTFGQLGAIHFQVVA